MIKGYVSHTQLHVEGSHFSGTLTDLDMCIYIYMYMHLLLAKGLEKPS